MEFKSREIYIMDMMETYHHLAECVDAFSTWNDTTEGAALQLVENSDLLEYGIFAEEYLTAEEIAKYDGNVNEAYVKEMAITITMMLRKHFG